VVVSMARSSTSTSWPFRFLLADMVGRDKEVCLMGWIESIKWKSEVEVSSWRVLLVTILL
jgi:hypothetical protein